MDSTSMIIFIFHTIRLDIVGLDGSLTSSGLLRIVLAALVVNGCEGLGGGGLCTFDAESYSRNNIHCLCRHQYVLMYVY